MAWLAGWQFRRKITIDPTRVGAAGAPHAQFPVLVSVAADAQVGAHAKADGSDVRFTASDGKTLLEYEVNTAYAVAGGNASGSWWVAVPSVSAVVATVIYMYFGNSAAASASVPANVWDANYAGVWHLETAIGTIADSTGYDNDGAVTGTPSSAAGKIGNGVDFATAGDRINCGSAAVLDNIRTLTIEAWFLPDTKGSGAEYGSLVNKDASNCWHISMNASNTSMRIYQNRATTTGIWTWNVASGEWQHLALTYSSQSVDSDPAVLINGAAATNFQEASAPVGDPANDAANSLWIGNSSGTLRTWDGIIDEVRISNVIRAAGWLASNYQTQADPGTLAAAGFVAWGAEESSLLLRVRANKHGNRGFGQRGNKQ